ncbi:hypothetical protein HHK36_016580 [Tetracentron sinense]|uniref:Uncharacterized protein n=1 Tax=Tetracentron sinense TaxID=13715 RepID=A0A834Z0Z9_TETSI|nr:hypothetical protein HHK36_016580 [Tetracentron sinense]
MAAASESDSAAASSSSKEAEKPRYVCQRSKKSEAKTYGITVLFAVSLAAVCRIRTEDIAHQLIYQTKHLVAHPSTRGNKNSTGATATVESRGKRPQQKKEREGQAESHPDESLQILDSYSESSDNECGEVLDMSQLRSKAIVQIKVDEVVVPVYMVLVVSVEVV